MKKLKKLVACVLTAAISVACALPFAGSAVNKDPNGDGSFDIADAAYIIMYLNGRFERANLDQLDINDNGIISQMDVYYVQLNAAGLWGK